MPYFFCPYLLQIWVVGSVRIVFKLADVQEPPYPEGPERHLNAARQKLLRDDFCRSAQNLAKGALEKGYLHKIVLN